MQGSRIAGLGHYQPSRVMTNDEIAELVDTDDAWIRSRVGIVTRHIAAPEETVAEMAAAAASMALASAGITAADVDMVVVATCTAEDSCPNTASRVARSLGVPGPAALDVNTACSGFGTALATADHAIRAGAARTALVVGAEKMSAVVDWTDRNSCILLGDGAGAAVVTTAQEAGIGPVVWGSVPELNDKVRIGGMPARFAQEGQSVFRWVTTALPDLVRETCDRAGVDPAELAAFVPHQANLRMFGRLASKLRSVGGDGDGSGPLVAEDVIESGNTSAASVPLAFSKLVAAGKIPSGAPVLLFGFGGGLSYAGQVVNCP